MAAINNQPAPKPASLNSPVPGIDAQSEADAFLSDYSAPQAPSADQQQVPSADAEAASFLSNDTSAQPIDQSQFETQAPQGAEINPFADIGIGNLKDFTTRFQAALGANDTEKLGFLKQKFGDNNAAIKDGELYFRRDPKEKLKKLDPNTFELINDIFADFSREAVTEVPQTAAMIGGAAAGSLVGNPIAGGIAARTAMAPFSNAIADAAASAAGVPEDQSRSKLIENLVSSGLEASLPYVGGKIIKRIPGTAAYKAAVEAGKKESVLLTEESKQVAQSIQNLAEKNQAIKLNGELVGVPGGDVSIPAHMLSDKNPKLKAIAQSLSADPKYINAETQLAENWGNAVENTLTEIGRRGNKGPLRPEELSSRVVNAVNDVRKAEGNALNPYKAKAAAQLKNTKLPLNDSTKQQAEGLLRDLGFRPRQVETQIVTKPKGTPLAMRTDFAAQRLDKGVANKYIPPLLSDARKTSQLKTVWSQPKDLNKLVGRMGIKDIGEARVMVNNLLEMSKGLEKGFTIQDIDRMRNMLGNAGQSLGANKPAGRQLSILSGEMRQTYRQAISAALESDAERNAFNTHMDEFGAIIQNIDTLQSALNEDSSAKAIVKNIFTGKENLQKVKAIKKLSPEAFGQLREEFTNQFLNQYSKTGSATGLDSKAMLNALDKQYGREFIDEVMGSGPKSGVDTLRDMLTVTQRIEAMTKNVSADKMSETQKKAIADSAIGMFAKIKFKAVNGFTSLLTRGGGRENALRDILTQDGIDKYVAEYPGKIDKEAVRKNLTDFLAQSKMVQKLGEMADKPVGKAVRGAVKREIIQKATND